MASSGAALEQLAGDLSSFGSDLTRYLVRREDRQLDAAKELGAKAGDSVAAEMGPKASMQAIQERLSTLAKEKGWGRGALMQANYNAKLRWGSSVALDQGPQALNARLEEAARVNGRVDPDTIIQEVHGQLSAGFKDDYDTMVGFNRSFDAAAQGFRDAADSAYFKRQQAFTDETRRLELSSRLDAYTAAAPGTEQEDALGKVVSFLTQDSDAGGYSATELPDKLERRAMILRDSLTLLRGVAVHSPDDARRLSAELQNVNLGGGAKLVTADTATAFEELDGFIDQMEQAQDSRARRGMAEAGTRGEQDAMAFLGERGGSLPNATDQDTAVSNYRSQLLSGGTPEREANMATQTYRDTLINETRKGSTDDDSTVVAAYQMIDRGDDAAEFLDAARDRLSASRFIELTQRNTEGQKLLQFIPPGFNERLNKSLFVPDRSESGRMTPTGVSDQVSAQWDFLSPEEQADVENTVAQTARDELKALLRQSKAKGGDAQAQADYDMHYAAALKKAKEALPDAIASHVGAAVKESAQVSQEQVQTARRVSTQTTQAAQRLLMRDYGDLPASTEELVAALGAIKPAKISGDLDIAAFPLGLPAPDTRADSRPVALVRQKLTDAINAGDKQTAFELKGSLVSNYVDSIQRLTNEWRKTGDPTTGLKASEEARQLVQDAADFGLQVPYGLWEALGVDPQQFTAAPATYDSTDPLRRPNSQQRLLEAYVLRKALTGYAPDEIQSRVTHDGIPIDPTQINWRMTPVFENLEQLESAWNDGKPTPAFKALANQLTGQEEVAAQVFYETQMFLIRHKR